MTTRRRDTECAGRLKGRYQRNVEADSASAAREAVAKQSFDLILLDLIMPGEDGLAFLRSLRASGDETPVLIVSALDTARTAVEALQSGAADYIVKGFDIEELRKRVANLVRLGELGAENERLRRELVAEGQFGRMLGGSAAMRRVFEMAERVAPTDATVLILGESGTGKDLLAQEIHARSPRAEKAVCRRKLRGAAGKADRIGTFRLRARRVHGRRPAAQGQIRAGVGRHAVSRRNRRHEPGDAGESTARAREPQDRAARRVAFDRSGCSRDQRDEPRSGRLKSRRAAFARICTTGCAWSRRTPTAKVLKFPSPTGNWWVRVRVLDDDRQRAQAMIRENEIADAPAFLVRLD